MLTGLHHRPCVPRPAVGPGTDSCRSNWHTPLFTMQHACSTAALLQVLAGMGGVMAGDQAELAAFLRTFERFAFLWQRDAASEYEAFVAAGPSLGVGPADALACGDATAVPIIVHALAHALVCHCMPLATGNGREALCEGLLGLPCHPGALACHEAGMRCALTQMLHT